MLSTTFLRTFACLCLGLSGAIGCASSQTPPADEPSTEAPAVEDPSTLSDVPSDAPPAPAANSGARCGTRGGVSCAANEFCNFEPDTDCGGTDRGGQCEVVPQMCTKELRPVCGCDRKTYATKCTAHAAGISVLHEGECTPADTQT